MAGVPPDKNFITLDHDMDRIEFDRKHIWHPYTSMKDPLPAYEVASADGVRLTLEDGRVLIDGMSSWWAVIHGYNNPVLNQVLASQSQKMSHVMFGGITHKPAVELAKLLIDITPDPLQRIFFCDSGSVSVEVALKMAFQYWIARGERGKDRILSFRNGYHGDTFGAMSVCDPVNGMHEIFSGVLPKHIFADAPQARFDEIPSEAELEKLEALMDKHKNEIAAVIIEPVVQGAGGMRLYSPLFLKKLRELCTRYGFLLIFDEIATNFGRTGKLFALEHADVTPDVLCLGKALTGGYMSLAATLTTAEVADTISSGNPPNFMHGPTFMGNPLACSVALASTLMLLESPWEARVNAIAQGLKKGLMPLAGMPHVADVRVLGAIGVVELTHPVDMATIQARFVDKGVWVRPFGKLVYVMPSFVMNAEDLATLTAAMVEVIKQEGPA